MKHTLLFAALCLPVCLHAQTVQHDKEEIISKRKYFTITRHIKDVADTSYALRFKNEKYQLTDDYAALRMDKTQLAELKNGLRALRKDTSEDKATIDLSTGLRLETERSFGAKIIEFRYDYKYIDVRPNGIDGIVSDLKYELSH